jgi:tetratricopeptide (TPR) repeat protein
MAELETLLEELTAVEQSTDYDALRRVREQIIEEHGDSEHAVEALYKVGLDSLFRRREFEEAVDAFSRAAKRKHPYWSAASRTSLGICLYHQGKKQKAIFELRKVGNVDTPSEHSITALTFIETIFLNEGNSEEVRRARNERINQLTLLVKKAREEDDSFQLGQYLYAYGVAQLDAEEPEAARAALGEAEGLGAEILGDELYQAVAAANQ